MSGPSAGIIGAGILGRLTALELITRGWDVSLFDRGGPDGSAACSFAAAGMLSPYCELESGEAVVCELGRRSLERWPEILARLPEPVYFQREGSLVVAHVGDRSELDLLRDRVRRMGGSAFTEVNRKAIDRLEPELDPRFFDGFYLPLEGQIDNRELLGVLGRALPALGVKCFFGETARVEGGRIFISDRENTFDWIVDCGGVASRAAFPDVMHDLRGVRGELLQLHAPDVRLNHPIRVMHPRYAVYIVPRPRSRFLVGATSLESEDKRPITVRSTLELLSAAFALHSGFGEASIETTYVNLRPAFPNNLPRIRREKRILHANGLYRNGFLLSPAISKGVADLMEEKELPSDITALLEEVG